MTLDPLSSPSSPPILLRGIARSFRSRRVLGALDLDVQQGEIYALLGENGAGKTTLMQILLGLLEASAGEARLLGRCSNRLTPQILTRVAYVTQDQEWPLGATLDRLASQLAPLYPAWDDELYQRLCRRFDLSTGQRLERQSRGQQARARLTLSLAYRPEVVIMDEPFSGLDPRVRHDVIDGLLELTEQESWTFLVSTHETTLAERLADRIGVLHGGRIVLDRRMDELLQTVRQIDLELESKAPSRRAAESWRLVRSKGHRVSFVDLNYRAPDESAAREHYRYFFPRMKRMTSSPATLEQVWLAASETD
ncbi:MAG: ABC transporter ATP-binding protein [Acidobacteriota bacterium]